VKREQAQMLVREVGTMIGIPHLDLDERGACTVSLREGRFQVSVLNDADGSLTLIATLCELKPSVAVLRIALEANHLWLGTGGATFSVNAANGKITLSEAAGHVADPQSLMAMLERLVETAEAWHQEFHEVRSRAFAAGADAAGLGQQDLRHAIAV
jgi:hypothetical protein